jgi:hypothetical protein
MGAIAAGYAGVMACCGGGQTRQQRSVATESVIGFEVWGRDGSLKLYSTLPIAKVAADPIGGSIRSKLVARGTVTEDGVALS